MKKTTLLLTFSLVLVLIGACKDVPKNELPMQPVNLANTYKEAYRPQYHFSPQEKWMNDPNGLVYHQGVYHLFYQYYPDDIVWGPMHWGHAVSKDMVYWEHKPIALFPDEHGYIFSGSAVVDKENSSGFGTMENPPLVAIFTYHLSEGEEAGRNDYQTQGIAYSLDNGDSWAKYGGNPVIPNSGIKDFRDPKVFWNNKINKWTMLLVAGDHLQIWDSDNLKEWEKVSEFGHTQGAHGGVWECPDMFPLKVEGTDEEKWVLLISINPGAPNGGSGTQYFVGDFDGKRFTTDQQKPRWIDWGTDNYAGVTYNNIPNGDRIFIGWMSNWQYARDTPTKKWRSAMTVPRKLSLKKIGDKHELINYPLKSLDTLLQTQLSKQLTIGGMEKDSVSFDHFNQTQVKFKTLARNFMLSFKNTKGEETVIHFDGKNSKVVLDRTASGNKDFQVDFGKTPHYMPVDNLPEGLLEIRILIDWSSVELFVNGGQYVMTDQIFPTENYSLLELQNTSEEETTFREFTISTIKSIW
ncbi:glycoside hydrolase family 32 protein [Spongiimicrobium sp. 3-5]|uniref:glycoside hydrolase family 32 protein n=1 Tax=Spongiimicrobium sp. 3-5 TaxID=3332596 RepID=UPI00397F4E8D